MATNLIKNSFFDILNLVDQLHKSSFTYVKGSKCDKIYFSENQVPDLIKLGLKYLPCTVKAYKKTIWKNSAYSKTAEAGIVNKFIKKLFMQARDDLVITFDFFSVK